MNQIINNYFYLLTLSPILAYIFWSLFNLRVYPIFGIISFFILVLITLKKKIVLPHYFIYYIPLAILYLIIDFSIGNISKLGIATYIYRSYVPFTIFILIIIENTKFKPHFIQRVLKIFKYTIFLSLFILLIQIFNNKFFFVPIELQDYFNAISEIGQESHRYTALFGYLGPNELGLSFIPITLIFFAYKVNKSEKISLLILISTFVILVMSNSRYIQAGIIFTLILMLVHNRGKLVGKLKLAAAIVILILIFIQILIYQGSTSDDYIENRLLDATAETRIDAILSFSSIFLKNPFLGTGTELKIFKNGIQIPMLHIGYLSHLVTYGLIGSLLLFSFWGSIILRFYKNAKKTKFWGSFYGFAFFLFANATLPSYSIFTYGIIFCFVFDKYFTLKHDEKVQVNIV